MAAVRPEVYDGNSTARVSGPGDILLGGTSYLANTVSATAGTTIIAGAIANGIVERTGASGNFNDTIDSSSNILAALAGSGQAVDVMQGCSFSWLLKNTSAFTDSVSLGTGILAGNGVLNCAASTTRQYLMVVQNAQPQQMWPLGTTSGSAVATIVLAPNQSAVALQGSNGPAGAFTVTPGMLVTGTGIQTGTTVLGIRQGPGGAIGVSLSSTATATATIASGGVPLTFYPVITIHGVGTLGL